MNKSLLVNKITGYIQLTKPIIILSVTLSALVGFVLARGAFSQGWMAVCIGVMLVAAGSSVFNQVQEAVPDKIMERTRRRPIPAGTISKTQAIVFAIIISLSGVLILWFLASPVSSLLAIITLAGYNLIYTPLKSITFFALIPGAMVGALPPAI
ncbi:MAG: UbiA family prenyltransferase, partial [Bacteroidales bacterium]